MSHGSPSGQIPPLVLAGIEQAFKTHSSWTNQSSWLAHAPELFVSVEIARHLVKKLQHASMNLEYSVKEACIDAGSSKRGRRRKGERRRGRFDILVSRRSGDPWCAIEVKSPVWSIGKGLVMDIHRIRDVLLHHNHGATIQCGAIAFYAERARPRRKLKTARDALASVRKTVDERVRMELKNAPELTFKVHASRFHAGLDNDGWQAFCVFFKAHKSRSQKT